MIMLAIFGDTASVEVALEEIRRREKGGSGGMVTARLTGNIWATRKSDLLSGYKLLLAEVIGGTRAGESMVVIDTIGAGSGTG